MTYKTVHFGRQIIQGNMTITEIANMASIKRKNMLMALVLAITLSGCTVLSTIDLEDKIEQLQGSGLYLECQYVFGVGLDCGVVDKETVNEDGLVENENLIDKLIDIYNSEVVANAIKVIGWIKDNFYIEK